MISIEYEHAKKLNMSVLINMFAHNQSRKKNVQLNFNVYYLSIINIFKVFDSTYIL